MPPVRFYFVYLFLLIQALTGSLIAQAWNLVKEKEGIKVYTRQEPGRTLKGFKGEGLIQAPAEKIFSLIEDINHTDWWDPSLSEIKVLSYEKNKRARYYLVYDTPWPVTDRDLCVDVTVTMDVVKHVYSVAAVSVSNVVAERNDRVRIKEYRQSWRITSVGANTANVILEGYVDPAGNIPSWLSNMVVTESPMNAIRGVKQRMENK